MTSAAAPVLVACALLVIAGAGKLRRPAGTVGAIRSVGGRATPAAVRVLGAAEVALGLSAATVGGPALTGLVALGYAGFTGFLVLALRRGGAVSSCGCLGRPDTPPTVTHALVTGALACACAAAAATGGHTLAAFAITLRDTVLLALTAMSAWLAWLAFAILPHVRVSPRHPSLTEER